MPMVATKAPYTLLVTEDDMAENPRDDYNLGTMVCWNRYHKLGDAHRYDSPGDFLKDKLFSLYSSYPSSEHGKPIYDFLKSGNAENARLCYNRSTHEWELQERWSKNESWFVSTSYPASLKGKEIPDWFLEDCLSALEIKERMQLLKQSGQVAILPLYLYDHSGITMRTSPFSCPWDSGQVGWIYADADKIKAEYGDFTPETLKKALEVMQGEVETYDCYLTGQVYGYQLFEGETETESCWGFYGDIRDVQNRIKGYLPDEAAELVEALQYQDTEFDIYDFLEETEEYDLET